MSPKAKAKLRRSKVLPFILVFAVFLALESGYFSLKKEFATRMPWGIRIANASYSLVESDVVQAELEQRISDYLARPIQFQVGDTMHELTAKQLGLSISATEVVSQMTGALWTLGAEPLTVTLDEASLREQLLLAEPSLEFTPINARVTLDSDGQLEILPEANGTKTDFTVLAVILRIQASHLNNSPITVRSAPVLPVLTADEIRPFQSQIAKLIQKPLVLKDTEYNRFTIPLAERLTWFDYQTSYFVAGKTVLLPGVQQLAGIDGEPQLTLNRTEFAKFVTSELNPLVVIKKRSVNISKDADGGVTFDGLAVDGRSIDIDALYELVTMALEGDIREIVIPYQAQPAEVTISADLQELGITELIGASAMRYTGSPTNRQHNISISAKYLTGQLIAPGEEWSFLERVGPITSRAGYRKELVIKGGDVIPEIGGGVCQVSTTFFRTILDAGLPIVAQRPHSLKVRYYYPPGLDATIYTGSVDLKFRNNTGKYILIQSVVEGEDDPQLTVNFYGTNDGRTAEMRGPYYPDGTPIINLAKAGMRMYWERILTSAEGTETIEKYSSAYRYH